MAVPARIKKLEVTDPTLEFFSVVEAALPPEGRIFHVRDKYWVGVDGSKHASIPFDDKVIVRYRGIGQYNTKREVIEQLCADIYPWATAIYMPSAFFKLKVDL